MQQFLTARGAPDLSCTTSNAGFCSTLIASFMRTVMRLVGGLMEQQSHSFHATDGSVSLCIILQPLHRLGYFIFPPPAQHFSDSPRFVSPVICSISQTSLAAGQGEGQEHGKERKFCVWEVEECVLLPYTPFPPVSMA